MVNTVLIILTMPTVSIDTIMAMIHTLDTTPHQAHMVESVMNTTALTILITITTTAIPMSYLLQTQPHLVPQPLALPQVTVTMTHTTTTLIITTALATTATALINTTTTLIWTITTTTTLMINSHSIRQLLKISPKMFKISLSSMIAPQETRKKP